MRNFVNGISDVQNILMLLILSLNIGLLFCVFAWSNVLQEYPISIIGAVSISAATAGVVYSKHQERRLKRFEYECEKIEEYSLNVFKIVTELDHLTLNHLERKRLEIFSEEGTEKIVDIDKKIISLAIKNNQLAAKHKTLTKLYNFSDQGLNDLFNVKRKELYKLLDSLSEIKSDSDLNNKYEEVRNKLSELDNLSQKIIGSISFKLL